MKKLLIISLILIIVASIAGFVIVYSKSAVTAGTPIMRVQSPTFLTNLNSVDNLPDPIYILMPIKSVKVLDNKDSVSVKLKSNFTAAEENELNRVTDMFKYNDLSKYSVLEYNLKGQDYYPYGGYIYLMEITAKLEIEFYPDEVNDSLKSKLKMNNNEYPSWDPFVHLLLKDLYTNQRDAAAIKIIDGKLPFEDLKKAYNDIQTKYYEKLIKAPEFLSVVKELNPKVKDLDQRFKAVEIFEWITNNITYDQELADNIYANGDVEGQTALGALKNKKTICVGYSYLYNALAKYYGLDDYVVFGKSNPDKDVYHSWNTTALSNGEYLNVDCTQKIIEQYLYDQFEKKHYIWDSKEYVPYKVKSNQ
jgi:hypothetical protein